MIPIRDDIPSTTTPWVNYFLIALNTLIFLYELTIPNAVLGRMPMQSACMPGHIVTQRDAFVCTFGFVPIRTTAFLFGVHGAGALAGLLPLLTCMFLHGSWGHLIGNMWFLWIFGDNVEDHLGHFRYLLMYLLAGTAGSFLQMALNLNSTIPSVGASGAIAGVMGAYFVLFPAARVLTLVPFFFVFFVWLPAWVMLGYWFVVQFLSGAATAIAFSRESGGGIAFWAHVGGFCAGLVLIKLFPSRPRRYRYMTW